MERFEELWRAHSGRVLLFAARHVGPHDAQEVVAEVFLVLWRRLDDAPAAADEVLPWLLGVARHVMANQRRADNRRTRLGQDLETVARLAESAGASTAEEVVEREAVLTALGSLSVADRETLLLVAWDGLTAEQAAQVLGCTTTAFRVRLHRARRRLEGAGHELGPGGARRDTDRIVRLGMGR
ncbi:RNA polymerase sigma factor [Cellulomonas cellasea]|uniref:RNA polymerase sigma-70 factor (ECF subfamily) n=1 Tax=Cellulomonas cellasea TaxID=43670 RepID=A0A7W4UJZ0_9CELL|nr:RNA polymerase sigma factor [Cellulomonas cellasea]MBB2925529.1 RNA polymerase sigma-70 factor (ECF subfamily) [Cellulomonas cellasea]